MVDTADSAGASAPQAQELVCSDSLPQPVVSFLTYEDARYRAMMKVEEVQEVLLISRERCEELLQKHRWIVDAAVEEGSLAPFAEFEEAEFKVATTPLGEKEAEAKGGVQDEENQVVESSTEADVAAICVMPKAESDSPPVASGNESNPLMINTSHDEITPLPESRSEPSVPVAVEGQRDPLMMNTAHDEIAPVLGKRSESPVRDDEAASAADASRDAHLPAKIEPVLDSLGNVMAHVSNTDSETTLESSPKQAKAEPTTAAIAKAETVLKPFRRTGSNKWKRIMGTNVACALCFEQKDGNIVPHNATNCGITICISCWGGYFRAEFAGGVRSLVRCPFPDCNAIVPEWLLEMCYVNEENPETEALLAAYRFEFLSDFVTSSVDLQFCPSPSCELIVRRHGHLPSDMSFVTCLCGYEFCFDCLLEKHFPLDCREAKELVSYAALREVNLLSGVFASLRRCTYCGILIENDGGCDMFKCTSCQSDVRWGAMVSCADSLQKCSSSPFSLRQQFRVIHGKLDAILFQNAKDVDDLRVVPGRDGPEMILREKHIANARKLLRFVKHAKVFFAVSEKDFGDIGVQHDRILSQMRDEISAFIGHLRCRRYNLVRSVDEILQVQQNQLIGFFTADISQRYSLI